MPPSPAARFFEQMGEEVKAVVGSLGYDRAQDLIGRYDLLEQDLPTTTRSTSPR